MADATSRNSESVGFYADIHTPLTNLFATIISLHISAAIRIKTHLQYLRT